MKAWRAGRGQAIVIQAKGGRNGEKQTYVSQDTLLPHQPLVKTLRSPMLLGPPDGLPNGRIQKGHLNNPILNIYLNYCVFWHPTTLCAQPWHENIWIKNIFKVFILLDLSS